MLDKQGTPTIVTFLDESSPLATHPFYCDIIRQNLKLMLPEDYFQGRNIESKLRKHLPVVIKKSGTGLPQTISFYSLSHHRTNAFKFFFEMLSRYLIPGDVLNVILLYAVDFCMPEVGKGIYTLCEVMIRIDDEAKLELVERAFPILQTEIKLGLETKWIAEKVLEVKGLSNDQKTAMVQQAVAALMHRKPNVINHEIVTEMQHILLITKEEFKSKRSVRQLARLIAAQYLFRRALLTYNDEHPEKRKVLIKCSRIPHDDREVLGITIGMSFVTEKEIFEKRQLLLAFQHHFSHVKVIPDSILINRRGTELLTTLYLEIEKPHGERFESEEINLLKAELPKDLLSHVEHLMHPIFMPRNEEEIMRNILALSQQLKYARDIPQVFISFDQQSRGNLIFTIILARVVKENQPTIQEHFKAKPSFLKYIHDRTKRVGVIRKKYPKEVTVFRVKFGKEDFLRLDHSIDLFKARQAVVHELNRLVGDFRDFNGGMISKQKELLRKVKERLTEDRVKFNAILVENFFYNLTPVIMQTVLEPEAFMFLFKMLLETIKKGVPSGANILHKMKSDGHYVYVLFLAHDRAIVDDIDKTLSRFRQGPSELATADISQNDIIAIGYIFRSIDENKKLVFSQTIDTLVQSFN